MRGFIFSLTAVVCVVSAFQLYARQSSKQSLTKDESTAASQGIEFTVNNGYPELHVGDKPLFVHAAYFDYFSIPRDLWEQSLDSYHDFAINTIALRIPWNWHEPQEGAFDFDGHSNPRRDLRGLLGLILHKGFKLIVAPGPVFDSTGFGEWRDGALPGWPTPENEPADSKEWLAAVAQELQRAIPNSEPTPTMAGTVSASSSLLYVIFDGPFGPESATPERFWERAADLESSMSSTGLRARFAIEGTLPKGAAVESLSHGQIDFAGRWFLSKPQINSDPSDWRTDPLRAGMAAQLEFLLNSLHLESTTPLIVNLDVAPRSALESLDQAADLYLAWAYQVAHGAGAIVQSGFQRPLPPPGYFVDEVSGRASNHAVIDVSGNSLRSAERARREADLVNRLGPLFASSHPRTVLGIVDLHAAAFEDSINAANRTQATSEQKLAIQRILRLADLADVPVDFVDPGEQNTQQLLRDPVLLLAIPESLRAHPFLSAAAEQSLLKYVRAGGSLICQPELPAGEFAEALSGISPLPAGDGVVVRNFEKGRVISWSKDFFGWVRLEEDLASSRQKPEAAWSAGNLLTLLKEQSASLPILRADQPLDSLKVSELVSNEPATQAKPRAQGILAVANWSDSAAEETIRVLPPSVSTRDPSSEDYTELPISLQPRDALFLPLDVPLCNGSAPKETCADRVVAAGAELVNFVREGKTLELTFYAPTKATIILHLDAPPHRVELLERNLDGTYNVGPRTFTVQLPRGAAPGFLRTLKFDMPYTPHVLEATKPDHKKNHDFHASVVNAMRYPLGEGASLPTYPSLVTLDPQLNGRVMINVQNLGDSGLTVHLDVSGAVTGSRTIRLEAKERNDYAIDLHAGGSAKPDDDGLLHAAAHLSGADRTLDLPIDLVAEDPATISHYRVDFERSGSNDWVLENDRLRVIAAPASGGTLAALIDTQSEVNLLSATAGFFDLIRDPKSDKLRDITLNTRFEAKWISEEKDSTPIDAISMTAATSAGSETIQITKQIRIAGPTKLSLSYVAQSSSTNPPALVTGFSVPAFAGPSDTQFCWSDASSPSPDGPAPHCELFAPNSGALKVPENLQRIEIHDHNRTLLTFACASGYVTIDQQESDARILWNLPPVAAKASAESRDSTQSNTATLTLGDDH